MNKIHVSARLPAISAADLAELKKLAAQALTLTAQEPGNLQYDCRYYSYFSREGRRELHHGPVPARERRWCTDASALAAPLGPFRPFLEGNALFGIGTAIAPAGARLRVGDLITVTSTQPPVLSMASSD